MLINNDWQTAFENEIQSAERARLGGNEGRARVCARRAASIVIAEHLRRQGIQPPSASAYELLYLASQLPDLPSQAAQICQHLTLRLEPDFSMPVDADLLAEARLLKSLLLGEGV